MKKSKYSEEPIAFALRQAPTGMRVEKICRKFGISQATLYNWKKKSSSLNINRPDFPNDDCPNIGDRVTGLI
jgi:putative transposase